MNATAFWIILLGFWIWMLQNRVRDLEKIVQGIKESKTSLSLLESEETVRVVAEAPYKEEQPEVKHLEEDVAASSVEEFKERYPSKEPQKSSGLLVWIGNYFTSGNLLVRIGGVVLFFGLAFLVKYAAEHSIISIQMRLGVVAAAAVGLIGVGWKLRDREGAYGQILQGLGIAILYLVIFASAKFYALFSLEAAFMMMLGVVVAGSALAVKENSLSLALFATSGGFLVPILTSTGEGSHVILFGYYALLNLGIFTVAWYRSWRILNVVGFAFTFVIATVWGVLRYTPEQFSTVEPFLILYFVMYLAISILFTWKHPFSPKNLVDGTLVFGLPMVAFPLQIGMVDTMPYAEAYSAVVLGALYVMLYVWLRTKEQTRLLADTFFALGVLFFTIAVPYIFDADVSAALLSLEASAIIWLSLQQSKPYSRYFGEGLLLLSMFVYSIWVEVYGMSWAEYMGYVIVIFSGFASAYLLDRGREQLTLLEQVLPYLLMGWSFLLWFESTSARFMQMELLYGQALIYALIVAGALGMAAVEASRWKMLRSALQGYLPLGILFFLVQIDEMSFPLHPFEKSGALSFGLLMLGHYLLLYKHEAEWHFAGALHTLGLWFITAVLMFELRYHAVAADRGEALVMLASAFVPLMFGFGLLTLRAYPAWLERYQKAYRLVGVGGLVAVLMLWELKAFGLPVDKKLLFEIPLFNPLDMMQLLAIGLGWYWIRRNNTYFSTDTAIKLYGGFAVMGMILASVIFARAVHTYQGVAYHFSELWSDIYFQAGLSILWSVIAIVLMLLSKHFINRILWMGGFGVLLIVVLKLFFIELANSGTIERIISFIVVGSLLLLIGYFVPLPPAKDEKVKG